MEPERPVLRSTKTRRRGWTPARQQRFEHLIQRYQWQPDQQVVIDVLDLGVGHGESTVGSARQRPDALHLAVELHLPGVGRLLDAIEQQQLQRVRVVHDDALQVLDQLGSAQVHEIRVLFPDPWPKARHHPRRLVRPDVVTRFVRVLQPGGVVHLATDHAEYATWMQQVMADTGRFDGPDMLRPDWRVDTRYSRRAEVAGRPVVDLRYRLSGEVPKA